MNTLLIIDMQEGFRFPETVNLAAKLKEAENFFSGEIIFLCFKDIAGSNFETKLRWTIFQDEKNQQIIKELNLLANKKIIFTHSGYSILTKELETHLSTNTNRKIFLSGIYTDVCILHTALELFDKNYEVYTIEDWCASPNNYYNNQIHSCALETIRHAIGKDRVINSSDLKNIL